MIVLVLLGIVFILLLFAVFAIVGKLLGLLLFLVIAALCGAVAEHFLGYKEGVGETLLIGLIGAALGVVIRYVLHLPALLPVFGVPIVWAIVGSFIVVGVLKLATGNRRSLRF